MDEIQGLDTVAQIGLPNSFLGRLKPVEWAALRTLGHTRTFPSGSVLMYEHEPGERVMVLLAGRVKITRASEDGSETLLGIRDPGDIVGELSAIDGQPRVGSVIALEPVEALTISADTFRRHLETAPSVAVTLLQTLAGRFRYTAIKRTELGASDTVGRLAARLIELVDRYGTPCDRGTLITLALSQEELVAWTGASRAGVAKALQTLRELGWIETQRRRIIVRNAEALRDRAA